MRVKRSKAKVRLMCRKNFHFSQNNVKPAKKKKAAKVLPSQLQQGYAVQPANQLCPLKENWHYCAYRLLFSAKRTLIEKS
jgi:hypothetical protein